MHVDIDFGRRARAQCASPKGSADVRDCQNCAARQYAICAGLEGDALDALHRLGRHRRLAKGQTLICEGDETALIANVRRGLLKLSAATADGREQILGVVGAGAFVGRMDGAPSACDVVALADSELCLFEGNAFRAFARAHPTLESAMLDKTMRELDRARRWLLMLGRATATERVATLLLDFADADGGETHVFPLSRGQMAELAGLTLETVSRQLGQFKKAGLIRIPTRDIFEICDRNALLALSGAHGRVGLH